MNELELKETAEKMNAEFDEMYKNKYYVDSKGEVLKFETEELKDFFNETIHI